MVTRDAWGVSFTSGDRIEGVRLNVYRFAGPSEKLVKGDADGKTFTSIEEAEQYAYERGYLQESVKPWCPRCRIRHTFLGRRSAFCHKHRIYTWDA